MSDIPDSWIYTLLPEIALIQMGQSPDSRSYNDQGRGLPFFQGKADFGRLFPTSRKWCTEPKKVAEAGDILLSVRAPVGSTNLAAERCCIGRGLAAIQAVSQFNQKYLLYYFRHIEQWLSQQGTGSTFAGIGGDLIRKLEIPVAPLGEQKRIVDKLDSVLARVDACRDRLEGIPIILENFRQSVITLAMSGKLTENIRKAGWENVALKDICLSISDGDHQAPPQVKQGVPFITIGAINDKYLDLNRAKRFVPYSYFEKLKDHQKPQLGDVLFSVTGSIAIPALVNTNESFVFQRHIAILKPDLSLVTSKFLFYLLCTTKIKNQSISVATGTAQKTIPLSKLRMFSVNIPSVIEQQEIIKYIDTMLIYADRIEDSFKLAVSHINCLTPSLLYKAYCGELVLQDPTDEPASVLLDRIRIMRETGELTFSKSQQRKPISDKSSQSMIVMLKRKNIQSSHLSDILKANGSMGSEALWLASQLDIDDFYDQLKDEEENGLLKEHKEQSIDTPRFLESV